MRSLTIALRNHNQDAIFPTAHSGIDAMATCIKCSASPNLLGPSMVVFGHYLGMLSGS